MENNIQFHNGGDANVTINYSNGEGMKIMFQVINALIGLIIFIISLPLTGPMMLEESRRNQIEE